MKPFGAYIYQFNLIKMHGAIFNLVQHQFATDFLMFSLHNFVGKSFDAFIIFYIIA